MMLSLPSSRKGLTVTAVAAALAAAAVAAVAVVVVAPDKAAPTAAERRATERGYTTSVTVPLYAPGAARPAVPRPAKLPPMIAAAGECKAAMDAIRDLQDEAGGGLTLSPQQSERLSTLLAALGPAPDAACSDDLAMKFRNQELEPWLTWTAPAPAPVQRTETVPPIQAEPSASATGPARPSGAKSPRPSATGTATR